VFDRFGLELDQVLGDDVFGLQSVDVGWVGLLKVFVVNGMGRLLTIGDYSWCAGYL